MAKIKDILEAESRHETLEQCRTIKMFQEGTFYRAYEWSAWLCVRYIHEFKATKRQFKNEGASMVFVGFPVTSLQKFTPENAEVHHNNDGGMIMILPETVFPTETNIQSLQEEFQNWKQSVPLTENAKKEMEQEKYSVTGSHPLRITDILHQILSYPIEQKSPLDCMSFLAEIKKGIAEIV